MSYDTLIAIQHVTSDNAASSNGGELHQVLELQLGFTVQLMSTVTNDLVFESPSIPLETVVFALPIQKLNEDPLFFRTYVADQLLGLLNISAPSSDVIVDRIASYIVQGIDMDKDFHMIAIVDNLYRTSQLVFEIETPEPITVELVPTIHLYRMEKLEENGEEDLGNCCICLDEMDCKESKVVRIPCGHVHHESCLSKWLHTSNSCPLCRTPLPIDEAYTEFVHEEESQY